MLAVAALLWALEGIDTVLGNALDAFGIRAWVPDGLVGILFAPFLHGGFQHLISNTVPLLVLGFGILVGAGGVRRFFASTSISALTSGLAAWFGSLPNTITIGASGVIFGWFTYSVMRGFWARDWRSIVIAGVVLFLYGGIIWGVVPSEAGVSWQGHLGGAIGGIIAASLLHRRDVRRARRH
ncbi:rhomboid family intramembrane serine protease [Mariniluteicoccus flavus]